MYYADESKDKVKTPHPLADFFFVSDNKELVLVDISEGRGKMVRRKEKNLTKWIAQETQNITDNYGLTVHGVVIAPLDYTSESSDGEDTHVQVVRGRDARVLLGGLDQLLWWM
eukprot:gene2626-3176_t